MKNKQKVNKIMDLIGFLSLNLQRKIQNIKVMKRSLIVGTYLLSLNNNDGYLIFKCKLK